MYTVAFGDTPPTSLTRFDEDCEEEDASLCVDDSMTNDFQLRDGVVKMNYVDGKPYDMYIAGLLTIYVGYTKSIGKNGLYKEGVNSKAIMKHLMH
jgi:hypothetical protein